MPSLSKGVVVVFVACGEAAMQATFEALSYLRPPHNALDVIVLTDKPTDPLWQHQGIQVIGVEREDELARTPKLRLLDHIRKSGYIIYLDADTRVNGPILDALVGPLKAGWDLTIAPSYSQGTEVLHHCGYSDRELTFATLGYNDPLALQAGVFGLRVSRRARRFMAAWYDEWARFENQDMGAMLRALQRVPMKVWVVGNAFNGGEVVSHMFGRARR